MYKLNVDGIKHFRKIERANWFAFLALILVVNALRTWADVKFLAAGSYYAGTIQFYMKQVWSIYWLVKCSKQYQMQPIFLGKKISQAQVLSEAIVIIILNLVYFPLICMLRKFHNFEFHRLKKAMISFYIGQMIIFMLIEASNVFLPKNGSYYTPYVVMYCVFFSTGLYPFVTYTVILYLKSNVDPLEGISKLDCMCLVSSTQKQNTKFLENVKQGTEWKQLQPEQKKQFSTLWEKGSSGTSDESLATTDSLASLDFSEVV